MLRGQEVIRFMSKLAGFECDDTQQDYPFAVGSTDMDGNLIGGALLTYHRKSCSGADIQLTLEGRGPWITEKFLKDLFSVVFEELGCTRCSMLVHSSLTGVHRAIESVGFVREGCLRELSGPGGDCFVYGMLKSECRWIDGYIQPVNISIPPGVTTH